MALNQTNKLVWIVETIYRARKISFEELNLRWMNNVDLSGHRGNFPWITPVPFCLADKFREYIPASKLQGSYLWDEMVEQQKKSLIREIIS